MVTNGIDRVQRARLAASGLAPLFDVVVTSQSCGYAKPDPRILHAALEAMQTQPRHAVYVGDDPATDGAAARAAGRALRLAGRATGTATAPALPCDGACALCAELASLAC